MGCPAHMKDVSHIHLASYLFSGSTWSVAGCTMANTPVLAGMRVSPSLLFQSLHHIGIRVSPHMHAYNYIISLIIVMLYILQITSTIKYLVIILFPHLRNRLRYADLADG